jgi:hypothetical protein
MPLSALRDLGLHELPRKGAVDEKDIAIEVADSFAAAAQPVDLEGDGLIFFRNIHNLWNKIRNMIIKNN